MVARGTFLYNKINDTCKYRFSCASTIDKSQLQHEVKMPGSE